MNQRPLPEFTRLHRYQLLHVTDWDRTGLLYQAVDNQTGWTVHVRELLPQGLAVRSEDGLRVAASSLKNREEFYGLRDRFVLMGHALQETDHPALQRVLDVLELHGTVYWVLEAPAAESFQAWQSRLARSVPLVLSTILTHLLGALEKCHARGLAHGGVSEESILIHNGTGLPILTVSGVSPMQGSSSVARDLESLGTILHRKLSTVSRAMAEPLWTSVERAEKSNHKESWQDAGEWQKNLRGLSPQAGALLLRKHSYLAGKKRKRAFAGTLILLCGGLVLWRGFLPEKDFIAPPHMVQEIAQNAVDLVGTHAGQLSRVKLNPNTEVVLRYIPAGQFLMGSPPEETSRYEDEATALTEMTSGYWLAETELTHGQWIAVMETALPSFAGSKFSLLPVTDVSAEEADLFLLQINAVAALPEGWRWALPSEAQWEYGCRAGTTTPFSFGEFLDREMARYFSTDSQPFGPSPVGLYPANAWGLRDMHGNVWELCADFSNLKDHPGGVDPLSMVGSLRVMRGGSWIDQSRDCRSANRAYVNPRQRDACTGFRLAVLKDTSA